MTSANNIKNISDLAEHKFLAAQVESMKITFEKTGLFKNNKIDKRKLTKNDKRLFDIFSYSTEVQHKAKQLDYTVAFINSFPATPLWLKSFNRAEYIEFHMHTYLSNIVGLYDRCLLLVNCLFDLGLNDKDVNHKLVTSNSHLRKTKTKEILERFYKGIEHIRKSRNYCTHKGRFDEKQLSNIHTLELIKDVDEGNKITGLLRISYQFYKRDQLKVIRNNNKLLLAVLDTLLTELHSVRLRQAK